MLLDLVLGGFIDSAPMKILSDADAMRKERMHSNDLSVARETGIAIAQEMHRLQKHDEIKKKQAEVLADYKG